MSDVLIDKRGHALWLTINRPEQRNALTAGVLAALTAALRDAKADTALRAIVITGAGDRAFCAGADLKGAGGKDGDRSTCRRASSRTHSRRFTPKSSAASCRWWRGSTGTRWAAVSDWWPPAIWPSPPMMHCSPRPK